MDHKESHIKIYYTKEYGRFRIIEGNRPINANKVKRIVADINDGNDLLRFNPITVVEKDGRLDITDGQHRFFVCKQLKCPIWYIISEEMSLKEIARQNSNTEKWKDKDFINCYAVQGNEHYIALEAFIKEYGLPVSVAIGLLSRGYSMSDGSGGSKKKFVEGLFVVSKADEAHTLAKYASCFTGMSGSRSGAFFAALGTIAKSGKIKIYDLVEKYKKQPDALQAQPTKKHYLTALEFLYNINQKQRKTIY